MVVRIQVLRRVSVAGSADQVDPLSGSPDTGARVDPVWTAIIYGHGPTLHCTSLRGTTHTGDACNTSSHLGFDLI
jgi:hypothetical protein